MYPKLEWAKRKSSWWRRKGKNRNKGITGFSDEQISSDKNPTNEESSAVATSKENLQVEDSIIQISNTGTLIHNWFARDDLKQNMVAYAYKLWGMDFVKMIECENWNRDIKAVGDSGKAFWLCQINTNYHKLPANYKENRVVQVETCYKKRKNGTKFYGPSRIIKGQKCSSYVSNRFTLEK